MTSKKSCCRILVLQRESLVAPGVLSLSVSARITELLDYLENQGIVEYAAVPENEVCIERAIYWADIVILSKHRSAKALGLVQLAKQLGKGVIYDIDDWIFSFPDYSGGRDGATINFSKQIICLADVITVANAELMHRVPRMMTSIQPIYLPNGMWVERYEPVVKQRLVRESSPRIVFTNADFLKVQNAKDAILSALNVFFMRHPDFVLDFFGDPFPEMFSLPFLHFTNRLPYQNYMRAIVSGHYLFAIIPLGATEDSDSLQFNACKNPFKYINYGTAKIPGIYSNADIYRKCVTHRKTGMLVNNTYEAWLSAMEEYAAEAVLRERVKTAAYEHIQQDFHARTGASVLADVLDFLKIRANKRYS